MKTRKSWREKLSGYKNLPQINPIPERMLRKHGIGSIVIPDPREVDEVIKKVPKGKLTTTSLIAELLAKKHKTTLGCTVNTGIFAWLVANAANEDEWQGKKRITPYWRVLKANGEVNLKYPGGLSNVKKRLESEGHVVVQEGKRHVVKNFEKKLVRI